MVCTVPDATVAFSLLKTLLTPPLGCWRRYFCSITTKSQAGLRSLSKIASTRAEEKCRLFASPVLVRSQCSRAGRGRRCDWLARVLSLREDGSQKWECL